MASPPTFDRDLPDSTLEVLEPLNPDIENFEYAVLPKASDTSVSKTNTTLTTSKCAVGYKYFGPTSGIDVECLASGKYNVTRNLGAKCKPVSCAEYVSFN